MNTNNLIEEFRKKGLKLTIQEKTDPEYSCPVYHLRCGERYEMVDTRDCHSFIEAENRIIQVLYGWLTEIRKATSVKSTFKAYADTVEEARFFYNHLSDIVKLVKAGCGNNGCKFNKPSGMATNGPCNCPDNIRDRVKEYLEAYEENHQW